MGSGGDARQEQKRRMVRMSEEVSREHDGGARRSEERAWGGSRNRVHPEGSGAWAEGLDLRKEIERRRSIGQATAATARRKSMGGRGAAR